MSGFEYIERYYGIRYHRGQRVTVDGQPGRVTSADSHLRVRFDGMRHSLPCHPTWRVEIVSQPAAGATTTTGEGEE